MASQVAAYMAFTAAQADSSIEAWSTSNRSKRIIPFSGDLVPPARPRTMSAQASDSTQGSYAAIGDDIIYKPTVSIAPAWVGWCSIIGILVAVIAPFINFFSPHPIWFAGAGLGLFIVALSLWLGNRQMT